MSDTIAIARSAVAEIAAAFPKLRMHENHGEPVELSITIPVQPGVSQEVWLALQNEDELTLGVGHFQMEWFPCSLPERARQFVDAVCGYLSGRSRILEHYQGKRCVKAELQEPDGQTWKTIATWSTFRWPLPMRKSQKQLRNVWD